MTLTRSRMISARTGSSRRGGAILTACLLLTACSRAAAIIAPSPAAQKPPDPELSVLAPASSDRPRTNTAPATVLSLDELRGCAVRIIDLDKADTLISVERTRIGRDRDRLDRLRDSIEIVRPFVNTRSKPAVDAYNRRIDAQRAEQATLTTASDRIAQREAEDRASRAAFMSACGGRPYRRTSNEALPPAMRAVIDRNSCAGFVPVRDR